MRISLISAVIVLLLVAANTLAFGQKKPSDLPPNPLDDLVRNGIVVPLDTDERTLVKKLGQPTSIERTKVKNDYYDFDDIVVTYTYPGLEISYYHHMHPEHGWKGIASIQVTSNEHRIKHGIYIGIPLSEINEKFGPLPDTRWEANGFLFISYAPGDAMHEQIVFELKDNVLTKFVWSNWP